MNAEDVDEPVSNFQACVLPAIVFDESPISCMQNFSSIIDNDPNEGDFAIANFRPRWLSAEEIRRTATAMDSKGDKIPFERIVVFGVNEKVGPVLRLNGIGRVRFRTKPFNWLTTRGVLGLVVVVVVQVEGDSSAQRVGTGRLG